METLVKGVEGAAQSRAAAQSRIALEERPCFTPGDFNELHIGEAFHADIGETGLAMPEEAPWAAQFEVDIGQGKTTLSFFEGLEPGILRAAELAGQEIAAALVWAPSDTPAELVKLSETETFGFFDDDDGGIGDIDADFHHCGRNENIEVLILESLHDFFLVSGFHFPMEEGET